MEYYKTIRSRVLLLAFFFFLISCLFYSLTDSFLRGRKGIPEYGNPAKPKKRKAGE
jgi:hypothetical protein